LNSNNMFDEKGKYSDEFLDDVKKYNWANTNVLKIYQYVNVTETTTTVNGQTTTQVTEGPDHNKYFKGSNVASGYANGIYLSNRQQYPAYTTLTDAVKNSINNFNNSVGHEPYMLQVDDTNNFTIYYCKFLYIVNGNVERSETIYWK
jgi:predicted transcriptional regulator